ncbi:MAG: metalloprotease [Paracoccaceae bacterium]
MLFIFVAFALCLATLYALRGGLTGRGRFVTIAGFDMQSLGLGVFAIAVAAYWFGPFFGAAITLAVMIHEFGHVAAYRVCGHSDARFRLIPLLGGVAISNQYPASQEKAFFITLLGPAICLAPMVLAYAMSDYMNSAASGYMVYDYPMVVNFLFTFAYVMGAMNFFNLLPFWPLDGGRIIAVLTNTFAPQHVRNVTLAMTGLAIAIALTMQAWFLLAFLIFSLSSVQQAILLNQVQRRMGPQRGLLALLAYAATIATFGFVGWPLLQRFI